MARILPNLTEKSSNNSPYPTFVITRGLSDKVISLKIAMLLRPRNDVSSYFALKNGATNIRQHLTQMYDKPSRNRTIDNTMIIR